MIGVLIITHDDLGKTLINTAEVIIGKKEYLKAISLKLSDGIPIIKSKIADVLEEWNKLDKIIIMVDLFGGTPCNSTIEFLNQDNVEVLTGVNLPMLLTVLTESEDFDINEVINKTKKSILSLKDIKKAKEGD